MQYVHTLGKTQGQLTNRKCRAIRHFLPLLTDLTVEPENYKHTSNSVKYKLYYLYSMARKCHYYAVSGSHRQI